MFTYLQVNTVSPQLDPAAQGTACNLAAQQHQQLLELVRNAESLVPELLNQNLHFNEVPRACMYVLKVEKRCPRQSLRKRTAFSFYFPYSRTAFSWYNANVKKQTNKQTKKRVINACGSKTDSTWLMGRLSG